MSINIQKNVFKCWVCDTSGKSIYYLVKRFASFELQQRWLTLTDQLDVRDFELLISGSHTIEKVAQKVELPREYVPLYSNGNSPYSCMVEKYLLKKRKISSSLLMRWKIGYCPSGEYEGRVVIPSFDEDGDVNYFSSRSFTSDWNPYKNPPVSKDIVFNELLVDWDSPVILVEGVFDAIHEPNMIPILGSTLSEKTELFQKIVERQKKVYIALDPDAFDKEYAIIDNLNKYGVETWKIPIGKGRDVGDMSVYAYQRAKQNACRVDYNYIFENIKI